MFSLAFSLDNTVIIDSKEYRVNLAFDNVLRFTMMLEDNKLTVERKLDLSIEMLIGTKLECSFEMKNEIVTTLINNFIKTNLKEVKPILDANGDPMPLPTQKESYSFKYDSGYIYTSFYHAYGIDLEQERGKLHWLLFNELLRDLPDDTKFKQVISIRERPYSKEKGSNEENKRLRELKQLYALPWQNEEAGEE